MAAATSSPLRRARDPEDDDDALEEGELRDSVPNPVVPVSVRHDGRRYLFQPRPSVAVDDYYYDPEPQVVVARRPQHRHRPAPRRRLNSLDVLFVGPGGALPSPTPSSAEDCDSDGTISDDDILTGGNHTGPNPNPNSNSSVGHSSAAAAAADAFVGRGWATTGKRGWKPGVVVSDSDLNAQQSTHSVSTLSVSVSGAGDGHVSNTTTTTTISAHSAPALAVVHHHQPPPPPQAPAPQHQPPPRRWRQRERERATEYTCKECGKKYPTNQALGGHIAWHRNKQREAAAMAAAAAGGDASALLHLSRRGGNGNGNGGKADHVCRKCGKVFPTGVALGGHMRVHYDGPPIVPVRKNKNRCLAPMPMPQPETPSIRVVRLFGIDIVSPEAQTPAPATLQQQQQQEGTGGTTTTEDGSSSTGHQEQH